MKRKRINWGEILLCYSDAENPVSHAPAQITSYVHFHCLEHVKTKNR